MSTPTADTDLIIGYANNKGCMVSLPPQSVSDGPITLEPDKPIVTREGFLTGFQPKLEKYVSNGILRRIMKGDRAFGKWDDMMRAKKLPRITPVPEQKMAQSALPPRVTISSSRGIELHEGEDARVVDVPSTPAAAAAAAAETAPQPKRRVGRPRREEVKSDSSIPKNISESQMTGESTGVALAEANEKELASDIAERDGKFWIGEKDFPTKAAAIAYKKLF